MSSEAILREPPRASTGSRVQGEQGKEPGKLDAELAKIDALWRAANYLSVGQIYLLDNFRQAIRDRLIEHQQYIEEHGEDMPKLTGWRWEGGPTPVRPRDPGVVSRGAVTSSEGDNA